MSAPKKRRVRSLTALEVLYRQVKVDPELDAYPEARRNLLARIRSLQRLDLDNNRQDVALALVLARRALLVVIPGLRGVEAIHALVRTTEQVNKALGALRREPRGSCAAPQRRMVLLARRVPPRAEVDEPGDDAEPEAEDELAEGDGDDARRIPRLPIGMRGDS